MCIQGLKQINCLISSNNFVQQIIEGQKALVINSLFFACIQGVQASAGQAEERGAVQRCTVPVGRVQAIVRSRDHTFTSRQEDASEPHQRG